MQLPRYWQGAAVLLALMAGRAVAETQAPNVLFILTDDQRADAVGYHPNPLLGIATPNIDRLAR